VGRCLSAPGTSPLVLALVTAAAEAGKKTALGRGSAAAFGRMVVKVTPLPKHTEHISLRSRDSNLQHVQNLLVFKQNP